MIVSAAGGVPCVPMSSVMVAVEGTTVHASCLASYALITVHANCLASYALSMV